MMTESLSSTFNEKNDLSHNRDDDHHLSMIEFFSGIGGMRLAVEGALKQMGSSSDCDEDDDNYNHRQRTISQCHAYDISLYANQTYLYNHCRDHNDNNNRSNKDHDKNTVSTKLVEQLRDVPKTDLWTLSPPCQPFTTTRGAKSLDMEDARCAGLKGIMRLLNGCCSGSNNKNPKWIFLENVQGFATSHMCAEWKQCLQQNGYGYQEYLLSPIQFGIPNHRLRYYMLCEYQSTRWTSTMVTTTTRNIHDDDDGNEVDTIHRRPPPESQQSMSTRKPRVIGDYVDDCMITWEQPQQPSSPATSRTLQSSSLTSFVIPDGILIKPWAKQLGVVGYGDTATHCFTAGYGRILSRSTGSILLFRHGNDDHNDRDETVATSLLDSYSVEDYPLDRTNMLQYSGRLRRFTPHELLRLFGFPKSFGFPPGISMDHQYKLVGNSINVVVVTELMKVLLLPLSTWSSSHAANDAATMTAATMPGHTESSSVPPTVPGGTLLIGGTKGHVHEYISGNLLCLYQAYRWKPLPQCTGRYTCREHSVSTWSPLELLESAKITCLCIDHHHHDDGDKSPNPLQVYAFDLPGRSDRVLVVPLDDCNRTGVITFEKRYQHQHGTQQNDEQQESQKEQEESLTRYVHTLNSSSGFRRKLNAIGIRCVSGDAIGIGN